MDFIAFHSSPWSEKAQWALDHHRIEYRYSVHVPMLGELPLRARVGKLTGKVTVPVLIDGSEVIGDSYAIARYADRIGKGAPLFRDQEEAIAAWNAKSDLALNAGRALVLANIAADREAQRESVPAFIPSALRGASVPVAGMGARYLARKYGTTEADRDETIRALDSVLGALRAALGGRSTLLGELSYADIAMAVVLQTISPVGDGYIALGPATRRAWTVPSLAEKYADLVAWRDQLYAKHRAAPVAPASA